MKKTIILLTWLVFGLLLTANLFVFVSSIKMGSQINVFDQKITDLKKSNLELENKIVEVNSFDYIATYAAKMNFTKRSELFYSKNLPYALNR